jgi:mRNA interferase HigB
MWVIARKTLTRFVETRKTAADYRALKGAVDTWYAEASAASWANHAEVQKHYRTASIINAERVVFNIKGNDYRLVVAIRYDKQIVFIKWIGTHEEYDKIDVATVQYEG